MDKIANMFGDPVLVIWYVLLAVLFIGIVNARHREKKDWNDGFCRQTYRAWRCFDVDSSGARGYTDGLGHYCWISYAVDKRRVQLSGPY